MRGYGGIGYDNSECSNIKMSGAIFYRRTASDKDENCVCGDSGLCFVSYGGGCMQYRRETGYGFSKV